MVFFLLLLLFNEVSEYPITSNWALRKNMLEIKQCKLGSYSPSTSYSSSRIRYMYIASDVQLMVIDRIYSSTYLKASFSCPSKKIM
jgi:hypothetical protein